MPVVSGARRPWKHRDASRLDGRDAAEPVVFEGSGFGELGGTGWNNLCAPAQETALDVQFRNCAGLQLERGSCGFLCLRHTASAKLCHPGINQSTNSTRHTRFLPTHSSIPLTSVIR